jgi:hypothetical protein
MGCQFRAVARGRRLRDAGELLVILAVFAAELVDHQIERRHDIQAEAPCPAFPKRVLRRTQHMAIGIVLPLQAEGAVRVIRQPRLALLDVIRRHELLVLPLATLRETPAKAHHIRCMQRGAARAVRVLHDHITAVEAVVPIAPPLRFGEALVNKILQLHAAHIAQHDARNVRRGR